VANISALFPLLSAQLAGLPLQGQFKSQFGLLRTLIILDRSDPEPGRQLFSAFI